MTARSLSNISAAVLLLLGTLAVSARHSARSARQEAEALSRWRVTYGADFNVPAAETETEAKSAVDAQSEIRLALPFSTDHATVTRPNYSLPGLHLEEITLQPTQTREVRIWTRQPGDYRVTAEFEIDLRSGAGRRSTSDMEPLAPDDRNFYLRDEPFRIPKNSRIVRTAIQQMVSEVESTAFGPRLQWIFDYCSEDLTGDTATDEVDQVLNSRKTSPLGRARTFVTLCRAAEIPARVVAGFELRRQRSATPHVWAEVYQSNRWQPFDPEYGYARSIPVAFLPIRRGGDKIQRIPLDSAANFTTITYSIESLAPPEPVVQRGVHRPSQILDLTHLPMGMHRVMSLILLLPFGALITALFRNIVGLMTFGTFAPALLAASFIYSDWGTGVVILAAVVSAGLYGRAFLERLHLLMVPRLSIVLTTIILCVVFGVSLLDYLSLTPGADAVLLPLVILTTLIERFHVTRQEDGTAYAGQLTLGTLIVAAFCYLMLRWDDVGHFILVYPEAHLFTLAAFVLIGRYSGYRLSELLRFRDLVSSKEAKS